MRKIICQNKFYDKFIALELGLTMKKLWYYEKKLWYHGNNYGIIPKTMELWLIMEKNYGKTAKEVFLNNSKCL